MLRAMRRAKALGKPLRNGKRQNRECIRAAKPRAEHRRRGPQDICVRIKPRHHPPRGFAMQAQGLMCNSARLQNPRPQQADGAEFRQRQEHVLVGGKRCAHDAFR